MKVKGFINGLKTRLNRRVKTTADELDRDQIGERRKSYNELIDRIEELESKLENNTLQVEKIKSVFLKNIYHEIRTPLNAIVGFTNLLEMEDNVNEQQEYRNQIALSSREFLKIMDNIIEASLIEAGMVKISEEECNLNALLSEIYAYFKIQRHTQEKGGIAFLLNVPRSHASNVLCDRHRINQVITNLLSNAFKFTEKGIVELGYKIENREKIHFYVKDSGIGGLSQDEFNNVFRSFVKLDNTANAKKGLGLGLSISKYLIEMMDGEIWYESNNIDGTTFHFTLPYHPVETKDQKSTGDVQKKNVLPESPSFTSSKNKRIQVS